MKKILLFLNLVILSTVTFAKSVDLNTAKNTGYNFYKKIADVQASDLSLVYKASSLVNGTEVTAFYVFNIGSKGFVIVSADDAVTPVLAYSTVSSFRADNIPSDVSYWLSGYQNSIAAAIQSNMSAGAEISAKWSELQHAPQRLINAKLTNTTVAPLILTQWDQGQFYDSLCPMDNVHHAHSLTGCVATAMAQVMNYFKWPDTGVASNSYIPYTYPAMGILAVDFTHSVYKWDSTVYPSWNTTVVAPNKYVAKLMYDAGVSVNMDYTANYSGSYVISASSPVTNCAEYALKTYFKYKTTISGLKRSGYSDAQWVTLLQNELNAGRPVIYEGHGNQGGHCFVCDGYDPGNFFDFNWGWSGQYNGYYTVSALAPGLDTFNSSQAALINIIPNRPTTAIEPLTQNADIKVYPNPAKDFINIASNGSGISQVYLTDMQGRLVSNICPAKNETLIRIELNGLVAGIYFLQLNTSDGIKTEKIIVTK